MIEPSKGPSPDGIRLQAYLAHSGIASRRACEGIILAGRVSINGQVSSELGVRVHPGDRVTLDGKFLEPEERKRYLLLNKPAGYICAMSDPEGRSLASNLLKGVEERVYNVGRLDQWSSGLILFTNDGDLASILVHPSGGIEKEYEIEADGTLGEDFFKAFRDGIEIEGVAYKAISIKRRGLAGARVVLLEGKNREIRKVLEHFGRKARLLRRIRIGSIALGDLPEGSFRELSGNEIESLRVYGDKDQ
jgi:23S rRNA pseudouridine2605 synthase